MACVSTRRAVVHACRLNVEPYVSLRHESLFGYADMSDGTLGRWLALRKIYPRAIGPMSALPKLSDTYTENHFLQAPVALDALGSALDADRPDSRRGSRGHLTFANALRNVADDTAWLPINNLEAWVDLSTRAGNAAKNVDRPEVSTSDMVDAHVANVMVYRAWVAQRLGVAERAFMANLRRDPIGAFLPR